MKNIYKILILLILILSHGCKKDPCENQVCFNGGVCVDGECICTNGYTGSNCESQPPCANVTCYNNGTCVNGTCNCPSGYSGTFCEIVDPCLSINCQNGGTCNNGICNCPDGFTGTYCQTEQTPTGFRIEKIDILDFPDTDGASCWDNDGTCYPDLYWVVLEDGDVLYVSSYRSDCTSSDTYSFSSGLPLTIYYDTQYDFRLLDYDPNLSTNDLVSSGYLTLSSVYDEAPYPSTLTLGTSIFRFRLHGDWLF